MNSSQFPSNSMTSMHVKINPAIVQGYSKGRASLEELGPNTALHPNPVIPASTSTSKRRINIDLYFAVRRHYLIWLEPAK
jgi:hypothetical protein